MSEKRDRRSEFTSVTLHWKKNKDEKDEKCLFVFTSPSPWFHVVIKQNNNNNNNKKKKKINKFPPLVFWSLAFSLFPSLSLLIFVLFLYIPFLCIYLFLLSSISDLSVAYLSGIFTRSLLGFSVGIVAFVCSVTPSLSLFLSSFLPFSLQVKQRIKKKI